ncbi:MAG TPA: MupA/Atu3671 family FMN-dependent luciferase-like monooxygenase [Gemmataceae bacterium]|nr:MupA/Atu3671 family FMN-dependent luciferase-like monooxygenase [Gemmataceae bacterium]
MSANAAPESARFQVVKNREGRYSLWPAHKQPPAGWNVVHPSGTRDECLALVSESWPDLRRAAPVKTRAKLQLGLMFFGGMEDPASRDKYGLLLDCARFADANGFSAIWLPERHFTSMGCLYPSPAVLHAALARETEHIRLRAGSVVLPLHNPIRVAEEWSVVDNLSGGRAEISFAPGWNAADFTFFPERYARRHDEMFAAIPTVDALWAGQTVSVPSGDGSTAKVRIYPTPVQKRLPKWVTAAGNPRSFERAGEAGCDLLTHLFDQDVNELAERIRLYREGRKRGGHDPAAGRVAVTLHTFVADSLDEVVRHARKPFCNYLKSNTKLLESFAASRGMAVSLSSLTPEQLDEVVGFIFEKFYRGRSLLGTPETCAALVEELAKVGVDEVACLIDFGPSPDAIRASLPHLCRLKERCAAGPAGINPAAR